VGVRFDRRSKRGAALAAWRGAHQDAVDLLVGLYVEERTYSSARASIAGAAATRDDVEGLHRCR